MSCKNTKLISILATILVFSLLIQSFLCGFRWPSDYVLTNHIISYVCGFVPRSLVGGLGQFIFGDKWYTRNVLDAVILLTSGIFILWTVILTLKSGYKFNNPVLFAIMSVFAISPVAKYYVFEAGYYEQYGYAIIIILYYVCSKWNNTWSLYVIPSVAAFIAILISESNLFLIVPIIFAFSAICILTDEQRSGRYLKSFIILLATYIPHLIYCIFIWLYKVPDELISVLQEHDFQMIDTYPEPVFHFRWDVHLYMSGDRSNQDKYPRELHKIYIWCFALIITMIIFVVYNLYIQEVNNRIILIYILASLTVGIASYSICIIGWDLDRYFFCTFLSVFFVTLFTVRKYLDKPKINPGLILVALLYISSGLEVSSNRFNLMDNATYHETISSVAEAIRSR